MILQRTREKDCIDPAGRSGASVFIVRIFTIR